MKLIEVSNKIQILKNQHLNKLASSQVRFKYHNNNVSDENLQYLHKSLLPTDFFQASLPRLPIPKLEKTCERYLQSLQPIICNREQFANTSNIVKKFENGIGKHLHEKLVKKDKINKHTSYISHPWFEMYLKSRLPLVLNYTPFLGWKDDDLPEFNKRTIRVTNFIVSALRFRRSLSENVLEPEIFHLNPKKSDTAAYRKFMKYMPKSIAFYPSAALYKAFPLDMSQYGNLFSSTRIPRPGMDELKRFNNSKHLVVMRKGELFSFDVLDENNDFKSPEYIYTCIKNICDRKIDSKGNHVAIFTTEDRDKWAHVRQRLIDLDAKNKTNIDRIDSALFVVCLDDCEFDQDLLGHAHNFLHGNPERDLNKKTVLNRWFDKSFQMMFTKDGHAGINFEHSWGDGVAVLRLFNDVLDDSRKHFISPSTKEDTSCNAHQEIEHLDFVFDNEIKAAADEAHKQWNTMSSSLDLNYAKFTDVSRNYFKKNKVSPDSMFQLAFQMAYYRLFNKTTTTYESCSTAAFKNGRTETVRPCTSLTKAFCEGLLTKSNNYQKKIYVNC